MRAVSQEPLLRPDPPPFKTEFLPVSGGHHLWVTQHGNPQGLPALLLHGGPGSGCSPLLRRFFDPAAYHLICVDQRGAGASQPAGGTRHNTTNDLLADLRQLRGHLALAKWLVVGGSWGATLALAHAADQPEAVAGLLLRAVFLARDQDISAFFLPGTARTSAAQAAWQTLAAAVLPNAELPNAEGEADAQAQAPAPAPVQAPAHGLLPAIASAFANTAHQPNPSPAQHRVAAAWWAWEQALAHGAEHGAPFGPAPDGEALHALVRRYAVQAHYLAHGCWLQSPSLLARAAQLPAVPTLLLHGTADAICPPAGAQAVLDVMPHSRLQWVAGAGHDPTHPGMTAAMVSALARFAEVGHFGLAVPKAPTLNPDPAPCPCA